MTKEQYPMERVNRMAQELPPPVPKSRAFAIDVENNAVLEYVVLSAFDVVKNKTVMHWTLAGVHKARAQWEEVIRADEVQPTDANEHQESI